MTMCRIELRPSTRLPPEDDYALKQKLDDDYTTHEPLVDTETTTDDHDEIDYEFGKKVDDQLDARLTIDDRLEDYGEFNQKIDDRQTNRRTYYLDVNAIGTRPGASNDYVMVDSGAQVCVCVPKTMLQKCH